MAIITRTAARAAAGLGIAVYHSFDEIRAIPSPQVGEYYWLLNTMFNLIYFFDAADTTTLDDGINTLVTFTGDYRIKLIGSV